MNNYHFMEKVYIENKKLDSIFDGLYNNQDEQIVLKNKLELLVELGELANETKCFKYWSNKKCDSAAVLEEYADCMLMVLLFFNMLSIELSEEFPKCENLDLINSFINLFNISSKLNVTFDKKIVKSIFVSLIDLGRKLGYTDEEIVSGCINKIKKNMERFETGF